MTEEEKIRKIESFGDLYCREHLSHWDKEALESSWWEALKFFFGHSFFRGRRDELSNEYRYFTIAILTDYFSIKDNSLEESYQILKNSCRFYGKEWILNFKQQRHLRQKNSIKHEDFGKEIADRNPLVKLLTTPKVVEVRWDEKKYDKELLLGNDEDVMMVLDILNIISNDQKKNFYIYLRETMKNVGIGKAYKELMEIRSVADKISSFTIRDIGLMNLGIVTKDYQMAFPIDTQVYQKAQELGCSSENFDEVKQFLVLLCKRYNIHPLKFAAGMWMWGFNNLDLES
jgi:hypothetical protein